jgi:hypothetical protein
MIRPLDQLLPSNIEQGRELITECFQRLFLNEKPLPPETLSLSIPRAA